MRPGNAILLNGVARTANREIGVPGRIATEWRPLQVPARLFRAAKRQPQTGGKQQVISLDSGRRITNKIIIQTELPAEPFADRGR
jgi:hypothetical protein